MATKSPIINILTYKLHFELTKQIYNEYQSRYKEAQFLIDSYKTYQPLKGNMKTVELLLALSIFHKRVITNLDAAVKFYGNVNRISQAETIKIGTYDLTGEEKNRMLAITMSYETLIKNFSIPPSLMDYNETKDFLKNLIRLKSYLFYDQNSETPNTTRDAIDPELPF